MLDEFETDYSLDLNEFINETGVEVQYDKELSDRG